MSLDHISQFVKLNDASCDKFLGGKLNIFQPKKGFRAGIDSVLLGASVAKDKQNLLELGAGAGVAALCVLSSNKNLNASLLENNELMLKLAQENILANGFVNRAKILDLDLTLAGELRQAAGLGVNFYDCVIANPPFFDSGAGTQSNEQSRANARHMPMADLDKWVRVAAASASPNGEVVFIFDIVGLLPLLNAFAGRFGGVKILPIIAREGQSCKRFMIKGIKGSKAPLKMLSPLFLHATEGREFLPEIDAVFRGEKSLDW